MLTIEENLMDEDRENKRCAGIIGLPLIKKAEGRGQMAEHDRHDFLYNPSAFCLLPTALVFKRLFCF